ncbi:MAG: 5-methyltetrahydropteroyltriglutamate--homocysteine S-methyltransferase [Streptosporangiales bacterium]
MTGPPFRAEHVGSLLRSERLLNARERALRGELSDDELRAIEDDEILEVIERQRDVGLEVATDGEFRRTQWHFDFFVGLDGVEFPRVHQSHVPGGSGSRVTPTAERPRVVGRVGSSGHPMVQHFAFLRDHTGATPKISLPAPSVLHFRNGRDAVDDDVYPDLDDFFADLGRAYADVVRQLADAGCQYLQFDETSFAYLCDPDQRQMLTERGDDPDELLERYTELLNAAASGAPPGMTLAMHMCRGNNRSNWHAQGGYEPIARTAFAKVNMHGYFMEYDTDRAGGFEPLRHLPPDKYVVLGLVTSKSGTLESPNAVEERIADAARHADRGQLSLSPQCGFASIDKGNILTADDQWRKLRMIVDIAHDVWG